MSKNANFIGQPIFSQLLKYIPKQKLALVVRDHSSDHYIKTFRTYDHLVSMLYASFHNCRSIREVVTGMMACHGKLQHLGLSDFPKRSTLSDANKRRDSCVFEALYFSIYKMYGSVLSDSHSKGRLDKRLFIADSTTISLFQEILKAAGRTPVNGKRKGGIKAHVLIKADEDVPCLIRMSSAATSDVLFLKHIHLPAQSILVFDKGYNSYSDYQRFNKENITWITRKNNHSVIETTKELSVDVQQRTLGVQKDELVILGNTTNKKQIRVEVRLITYFDEQTGKLFEFITNNKKMKSSTIAQLYQKRWQVETLFKRLKQNNQLRYFLGDNENAIKIQIWCSLIADLITKIIQRKVKRSWSFANLSSMLRIHLMSYTGLYQFLENPDKNNFEKTNKQPDLFSLLKMEGG